MWLEICLVELSELGVHAMLTKAHITSSILPNYLQGGRSREQESGLFPSQGFCLSPLPLHFT